MAASAGAMSTVSARTPRCSARTSALRALAEAESRSGRISANTRCAPTACTASAMHTELSTPPEIATTRPRLCSSRAVASRRRAAMRATSAA